MSVPNFAQGVTSSGYWAAHIKSLHTQATTVAAKTDAPSTNATTKTASTDTDHKSFWDDLWDTVNPLEHFPVVSTIYDKITHNHVGDLEKVAGDTLYGGPVGLASSLANVAFEHITGKSFGDMVLGWVTGDDDGRPDTVMAEASKAKAISAMPLNKTAAVPSSIAPLTAPANDAAKTATANPTPLTPNIPTVDNDALIAALQRRGASVDLQARALGAYHRTMDLNTPTAPVTNTVH
jgi:hypothetical protein